MNPAEKIAEAIRDHFELDDYPGDHLFEGAIDVNELAAEVAQALGLAEEFRVVTDMGVAAIKSAEHVKHLTDKYDDMTAQVRHVTDWTATEEKP